MPLNHTPLPWIVSDIENGPVVVCGQRISCTEIYSKSSAVWIAQVMKHPCNPAPDDAAFIDRSVNSHYELLDACKDALWHINQLTVGWTPTRSQLEHAIAKAEGGQDARKFAIEVFSAGAWKNYDSKFSTIAEGNERLLWLRTDQPERSWRLVEVLG